MNSGIEEFLDHVDQWKFSLHKKLKTMTSAERQAFWVQIHEEVRLSGLPVVEAKRRAKPRVIRARRTGLWANN